MNIKIKRAGTVHFVLHDVNGVGVGVWTRCGQEPLKNEYKKTTEPLTCKTCIKLCQQGR